MSRAGSLKEDEFRALGVVGTAVIDQIFSFDDPSRPIRSMGGIYYSLHTLAALAPHPSLVVPALRLGADAVSLIRSDLAGMGFDVRFLSPCSARQNRVDLHYTTPESRREILRGGVPALGMRQLAPVLREIDFLYVNFVAGNELTLETLRKVRRSFAGPIYADLHSLLLGRTRSGLRFPRPIPRWREWVACIDFLQCNAQEAAILCGDSRARPLDPRRVERLAAEVLGLGPRLFILTSGPRPVRAWTSRGRPWRFEPRAVGPRPDSTGCGDVLGAAFCALHFLHDLPARSALARAVEVASWKTTSVGTDDLAARLRAWYVERHG